MGSKIGLPLLAASLSLLPACFQSAADSEHADGKGGAASAGAGGRGGAGSAGSASIGGVGGGSAPVVGERMTNCAGVDSAVTLVVNGDVKENTTWSGTVFVSRPINVTNAALLTIAPGTSVVMGADSAITVGDKTAGGAVQAAGAAEAPIALCGKQATKGYWGGLGFGRYTRSDSALSHFSLSDAGAGAVALLLDGSVHVSDVTVRNTAHDGVWASIFGADSQRLNLQGNDGAAAVVLSQEAANAFPLGGSFGGNAEELIRVRFNTVDKETHFHDVGLPYLLEAGLLVRGGAKLVYEAGVEVRFAADTALVIGAGNNPAELAVQGSAEKPVLFRGVAQTPGFWQGIDVGPRALTSTRIEHAKISDAGGKNSVALSVETAATLIDVTLQGNVNGMLVSAAGLQPDSTGLSITGTQASPLIVAPDALVSIPAQSTFSGNTPDYITVQGGNYTKQGTVVNFGVPYLVSASISSLNASAMTIAPGTKFLMGANTFWEIGAHAVSAKIVARGTADMPIEFSGQVPNAGSWGALIMYTSVTADSAFDYVHVSHGGGTDPKSADLVLSKAFAVTHSSFSKSFGHGIVKWKDDPTDYTLTNSFADNASAPVGAY